MKIAHIIHTLDFSGQSINMLNVALGQEESGHEVAVLGQWFRDFTRENKEKAYPSLVSLTNWKFYGDEISLLTDDDYDIIFYWGAEKQDLLEHIDKEFRCKKVRIVGQIYSAAISTNYL